MFIEPIRSSQNEKFAINANTVLKRMPQMRMSENVVQIVENAITERRRPTQRRKRVYRAKTSTNKQNRVYGTKMSPAKAKTRLQNENVAR